MDTKSSQTTLEAWLAVALRSEWLVLKIEVMLTSGEM